MNKRNEILSHAKSLIGYTKYRLGAKWYSHNNNPQKPKFLDCSGFVVWCYKQAGYKVADGTYYQWQTSQAINYKDLKIGDIGILKEGGAGEYNHVGLYAGDGNWIHCNYSRNGVTLEKTNIFKYYRRFKNVDFKDEKKQKNKDKEDKEMVQNKIFLVNGKKTNMEAIEKDGYNFVKLQSLKDAGVIDVSYNKDEKIAVIKSK